MKKYIVNLFIALSFQAVYCGEPVIPATNGQVRTFRAVFAKEIKEQACQFEAIGIFVFINKLVSGQMTPQQKNTFEKLGAKPIQIAEAVRLGYGFDRGVCSDLVVSPTEMASYKTALTGIGKHVSNKSKKAEEKHVFTTNASQAAIAAHLNFSNSLMYKAEEESANHVKFMYAYAKIAGDKDLERSIDSTPKEIEALREKAVKFLQPLFSTSIEHLRELDTSMLQRIGEFSEDEEHKFASILFNARTDVHHEEEEEEAERESSDENEKRDFQSTFSNPGTDVSDEIQSALGKLFDFPEEEDEQTPETLEKFLRKLLRKGQKNCFDALVSNGLVGSLLDEYDGGNPLNFTSLLTLCAYADIPEIRTDFSRLTLLTGQNIPEHERKAETDFSRLTLLTGQNIPGIEQDKDPVRSNPGEKSHHHHAKKPLALTAAQEKVISVLAEYYEIQLNIIMEKFSIEQLTQPIDKLQVEVTEFKDAFDTFNKINIELVSQEITDSIMRDCFDHQTAKQFINFVNMIKSVNGIHSHNRIELIEKLSAAVLIKPEILDNRILMDKVIDWLYGAKIDAEDSLFAAECGFLPNKESFHKESEHSWGDIAQQHEDRQREKLRLKRQQKYDDLDIDIINMSLGLTDDEFRNCYWESFEETKDELGYYPLLNTDRLKRSIRNILSSKIR